MRRYILSLFFCVITFNSWAESDVMLIFNHDGSIYRFLTEEIDSIAYSSVVNSNGSQVKTSFQEIWLTDSVCRISVEEIDSIRYVEHSSNNDEQSLATFQDARELVQADKPDYEAAAALLQEAAANDCDSAQLILASFYEYELGEQYDMEKAKSYYMLAADNGIEAAAEKLDLLNRSNSSIEMPDEVSLKPVNLYVQNVDTLRQVNGDGTFAATGQNITLLNENLEMVYFSIRSSHNYEIMDSLLLNSKETAVSLLLFAYPYVFSFPDEIFGYFKEYIASLPETDILARKFDQIIANKGFLNIDDAQEELSIAAEKVLEGIGINTKAQYRKASQANGNNRRMQHLATSAPVTSKGPVPPSIRNKYSAFYDIWAEMNSDAVYSNMGWDCDVEVFSYTPLHLALQEGHMTNGEFVPKEGQEVWDHLIKPANSTATLKAIGLKGFHDMVEAQTTYWNHMWDVVEKYCSDTSYQGFSGFSEAWEETDPWDIETKTITVRLEDPDDVLYVLSPKDNDIVFFYSLWDVVVWPVLKPLLEKVLGKLSKMDEYGVKEESVILETFKLATKYFKVDHSFFVKLRAASEEGRWDDVEQCLAEHFGEKMLKGFLKECVDDFVESVIFPKDFLSYQEWQEHLDEFDINNPNVDLTVDNPYKLYEKVGKWTSWGLNLYAWLTYEPLVDSYPIYFDFEATKPFYATATTEQPTAILGYRAIVPISVSTNAFIKRCGVVYSEIDSAPTIKNSEFAEVDANDSGFAQLTDLRPNRKYYARAYAEIDKGFESGLLECIYGNTIEFTTTDDISSHIGQPVDLGVSVYWADCNVGAESPEQSGWYYAWGDPANKATFTWPTYSLINCDTGYMIRYSREDGKLVLYGEDDVATANWGSHWRMPTIEECQELVEQCDWSDWTMCNGIAGRYVYNRKDHSKRIFLPAAGYIDGDELRYYGETAYIWSSTRADLPDVDRARYLLVSSSTYSSDFAFYRSYGRSVRPVCEYENFVLIESINFETNFLAMSPGEVETIYYTVTPIEATHRDVSWMSDNPAVATVENGIVRAVDYGICNITATANDGSRVSATCTILVRKPTKVPVGAVDLGLPSGTLWAECNVGATSKEQRGDLFAWAETQGYNGGKTSFSWSGYKYCNRAANKLTKYCTKSYYGNNGFTDNRTVLEYGDDAAAANLTGNWRMPTVEEWNELATNCTWTSATVKGVNGCLITGKNGNTLFLPAAGYRDGASLYDADEAYYWTSSLDVTSPDDAWFFYFGDGHRNRYDYYRSMGRSVRPVYDEYMGREEADGQAAAVSVRRPATQPEPVRLTLADGKIIAIQCHSAEDN